MSWSTTEVAELAGTTVKAIRHYHSVGLLDEPERRSNGYKMYTTAHLLRILQIRRMSDLGVSLAQIAELGTADRDPRETLQIIDAELATTIERLQRIRAELALMQQHGASLDLPAGFAAVAGSLTTADRDLLTVFARLFDDESITSITEALKQEMPEDEEFATLPADAPAETIADLARRLVPIALGSREQVPWVNGFAAHARTGVKNIDTVIGQILLDLYNPAQLQVMIALHDCWSPARAPMGASFSNDRDAVLPLAACPARPCRSHR